MLDSPFILYIDPLGITLVTEWVNHRLLRRDVDLTYVALVACDILLQRQKKTLSMLWSEHYAALNTSLRKTWKHRCKVEDKLRCRVCDNCQVAVVALSNLLVELYLDTGFLSLCHNSISLYFYYQS